MMKSKRNRDLAAVILAGGQASRCGGIVKGLVELAPGITILARMIGEIRRSGLTRIAISANDHELFETLGLPVIPDLRAGLGPISGIESGLLNFRHPSSGVLFLPCDMPAINASELSALVSAFARSEAKAVFARDGSSFDHPLCAIVRTGVCSTVSRLIDNGCRSIKSLWSVIDAEAVQFDSNDPFFNINAPADIDTWRKIHQQIR